MGLSAAAVERVMRLTAVTWTAIWLCSLGLTLQSEPDLSLMPGVSAVGLLAVGGACVVALLRPRRTTLLVTVAVANAVLQTLLVNAPIQPEYAAVAGPSISVATVVAALLLANARRAAQLILVLVAVCTVFLMASVLSAGADAGWGMVLDTSVRGAVNGMGVLAASAALRRLAREADARAEDAAAEREQQARRVALQNEAATTARLLHDTFINTLGVIRRGVSGDMASAVRERCALDLALVRAHLLERDEGPLPVADLLDGAEGLARSLGLRLDTDAAIAEGAAATIDADTGRAAAGVIREALLNVSKHAGTDGAELRITVTPARISVAVRDRGVGMGPAASPGFGMRQSVMERVRSTRGDLRIDEPPGGGTLIMAEWPHEGPAVSGGEATPAQGDIVPVALLRTVSLRVTAWFSLMVAVAVVPLWRPETRGAALAGLAVWAVCLVLVFGADRFSRLPSWRAMAAAALIWPMIVVPSWDVSGCPATGLGAWGLDAAVPVMVGITLLAASRLATAVAFAAVVAGVVTPFLLDVGLIDSCAAGSAQALLLEIGTFVAIVLFNALVERLLARARQQSEMLTAIRAEASAREAQRAHRDAVLEGVLRRIEPTLSQVATGLMSLADPHLAATSGRQETALRSIITIDPGLGDLGRVLSETVLTAYDSGRTVDVRSGESVAEPSRETLPPLARVLEWAVARTSPGCSLSVTLLERDGRSCLMLVFPGVASAPRPQDERDLTDAGATMRHVEVDGLNLVEVEWTSN